MNIEQFLSDLGVTYERFDHPAVFTVEESSKLPAMPGADTKNLFLREEKGTQYYLVTIPHDKRADLKALAALLGAKRLVFGTPEDLQKLLGVTPGSVTLLGLMNDTEHRVVFWIDQSIWDAESVQCHPLVNTATIIIPHEGLEKFLAKTGHKVNIADIPAR